MLSPNSLKKLSLSAAGASVLALGLSAAPAQAFRSFEVTLPGDTSNQFTGSFTVDETTGGLFNVSNLFEFYPGAISEATVSPSLGSFSNINSLDLLVFDFSGDDHSSDFISFFDGFANELVSFTFADNLQFFSVELGDVLDSLDGSTAVATSTEVPNLALQVQFKEVVEPEPVAEPTSALGLLTVGALCAGSALKRKQKQSA